jgi:hypothetical protein
MSERFFGCLEQRSSIGRVMLLLTAIAQVWAVLMVFDPWHYNNDPLNDISNGLTVDVRHPAITRFAEFAIENCRENFSHPRLNPEYCAKYQNVITTNLYFNYPATAVFGLPLGEIDSGSNFLELSARMVIWATFIGVVTVAFVTTALLWTAHITAQIGYTAVAGGAMLASRFFSSRDSYALPHLGSTPEPSVLALVGLMLLACFGAIYLLKKWTPLRPERSAVSDRLVPEQLVGLLILSACAVLVLRAIGLGGGNAQVFALILGVACILVLTPQRIIAPISAITVILIFYFAISYTFIITPQHPRTRTGLVFMAVLAACTVNPRSRIVYALPLSLLFHVSMAGLLALLLVLIEALIALARRQTSRLLWVAIVTSALFTGYSTLRSKSDLVSTNPNVLPQLFEMATASPIFFYGLAVGCSFVTLAFYYALLSRKEENYVNLARAAMLVAALAVATGISNMIVTTNPEFKFTAGWYALAHLSNYLGPAIAPISVLITLIWLLRDSNEHKGSVSHRSTVNFRRLLSICALICFVAAQAPSLANIEFLTNTKNAMLQLTRSHLPQKWGSAFSEIANDPTLYVVARNNPLNDPRMYFSLLKLRAQIASNVFPGMENMKLRKVGTPVSNKFDSQ